MAAGWMKAKMLKLKKDGMARTRGANKPFCKIEKDGPTPAKVTGWYLVGPSAYRGAASTFGPFTTEGEARTFAKRLHLTDPRIHHRAA